MHARRVLPALLAAALSLRPASTLAQDIGPEFPEAGYNRGEFRFGFEARSALQALWRVSIDAKEERVACIGGFRQNGITYITRIEPVEASADSLNVAAEPSLQQCKPPEWLGTVHTHLARIEGQPMVTFSSADRRAIMQWHHVWREDGVFCVLYDDRRAHCEAGFESSGEAYYAYHPDDIGL